MHPLGLITKANTEDHPTWEQAMSGPNRDGYWKSDEVEIEALKRKETWDVIEREDWMHVLHGTWAFSCQQLIP